MLCSLVALPADRLVVGKDSVGQQLGPS